MDSNNPHLIDIVKISDPRGNLSVLQHPSSLPFEPVRAYWIHDVPGGMIRDGHAFYSAQEVIVALSGSFDVTTEDSTGKTCRFTLSRANQGLLIPAMTWRELHNFATNSVALIVSSTLFDEVDYIRDKSHFDSLITNDDDDE